MSDVLERLRAANPVPDIETVTGEEDRYSLPPDPRTGRRITTGRRVAALAAVVAALLLAVGLPGDRSSGPDSLGRIGLAPAVAATLEPGDSILHIVSRTTQSGPRGAKYAWRYDVWVAPEGGGRVRLVPREGDIAPSTFTNPHARDPVAQLRDMLEAGTLRPTGRTTLDGRAVEQFTVADEEIVLYADADTLQPVRSIIERGTGQGRVIAVTDFVRIERLADTPENRRRLD